MYYQMRSETSDIISNEGCITTTICRAKGQFRELQLHTNSSVHNIQDNPVHLLSLFQRLNLKAVTVTFYTAWNKRVLSIKWLGILFQSRNTIIMYLLKIWYMEPRSSDSNQEHRQSVSCSYSATEPGARGWRTSASNPLVPSGPLGWRTTVSLGPVSSNEIVRNRLISRSGRSCRGASL